MRLREYIEKKRPDEIRGELIRAIELASTVDDMKQVVTMITSAREDLDSEDWIYIQQHYDRKLRNTRLTGVGAPNEA